MKLIHECYPSLYDYDVLTEMLFPVVTNHCLYTARYIYKVN